jgi:hypothetical protein
LGVGYLAGIYVTQILRVELILVCCFENSGEMG